MILPSDLQGELRALLREIEYCLELLRTERRASLLCSAVSDWSVIDHLDHLAAADAEVLEWLLRVAGGTEVGGAGRPTLAGHVVLLTGVIPRGRGKAPESMRPKARSSAEVLDAMSTAHSRATDLGACSGELRANTARTWHFAFGNLNAYQWIRVGHIHHRHHRKIVQEIMKEAR